MNNILRIIFYTIFIKFIIKIIIGLNIKNLEKLPKEGPAIIIANHNSHLDTMIIMSLLPIKTLLKTYPVASMDYFLKNPLLSWFSLNIIGVIPIKTKIRKKDTNPLKKIYEKLDNGSIIIYYPEGSRGEPEKLSRFKTGIAHISKKYPNIPITPIAIHGAGTVLPKKKFLIVPFICQVTIGDSIYWQKDKSFFMHHLYDKMSKLIKEGRF